MTESKFRSLFLRTAFVAVASMVAATAFAQSELREGYNYTVVKPAQATSAPAGKTEVIEFFGYWCPHCNDFEPVMLDWAKRNEAKAAVIYVPIPLGFQAGNSGLQKLYYTLDTLGKEKELRRKVFSSIHVDRSLPPSPDVGTMADWAARNGIDKKTFIDTLNSFTVQTKVNRANQIAAAYGVTGVPTLAIGGKYLLTIDAKSIGNADVMLARVAAGK
jgi:thiol:disulfide interchange protein DsbA